jgi:hypothetical protein
MSVSLLALYSVLKMGMEVHKKLFEDRKQDFCMFSYVRLKRGGSKVVTVRGLTLWLWNWTFK